MFHPWELALSEKAGLVSSQLLLVESIWKKDASRSELEFTELPVSGPKALRQALDAEAERTRKASQRAKPAVIMPAPRIPRRLLRPLRPRPSSGYRRDHSPDSI